MGMFREVEKSKNTRVTLLRLWGYLQHQKWGLIISSILVVITTIVGLALITLGIIWQLARRKVY